MPAGPEDGHDVRGHGDLHPVRVIRYDAYGERREDRIRVIRRNVPVPLCYAYVASYYLPPIFCRSFFPLL